MVRWSANTPSHRHESVWAAAKSSATTTAARWRRTAVRTGSRLVKWLETKPSRASTEHSRRQQRPVRRSLGCAGNHSRSVLADGSTIHIVHNSIGTGEPRPASRSQSPSRPVRASHDGGWTLVVKSCAPQQRPHRHRKDGVIYARIRRHSWGRPSGHPRRCANGTDAPVV